MRMYDVVFAFTAQGYFEISTEFFEVRRNFFLR